MELKHEVIEGLRPSHLDNLGLSFAMRSHCREFTRRTGLPCEVEVAEDFDDLDPAWSIAFYRIAQESLTNITKHAQATPRAHCVESRAGGIRLRIVDDGVGLAEESLRSPSRTASSACANACVRWVAGLRSAAPRGQERL